MSFIPMSLDDIAALDATPDKPKRVSKAKGVDTSVRDVTTWFKLVQHFGECENPDCEDKREKKVSEGKAMVAEVGGKHICRICFRAGYNKE